MKNVLKGLKVSELKQEPLKSHLYDLNRIVTGDLFNFTYLGDLITLCGWEGTGKTYFCMNIAKAAQEQGFGVVVIDTEGSWKKLGSSNTLGIDLSPEKFAPLVSSDLKEIIMFLKSLYDNIDKNPDERVLIIFDSIAGLFSEKEQKDWEKGEIKLDQGLEARVIKRICNSLKSYARKYDIPVIVTTHVYKQSGQYLVLDNIYGGGGIKFYSDVIISLRTAKEKDKKTKEVKGIIIEAVTLKNRNIPPFQKAFIGLDFATGRLDPYIGLVDMAVNLGFLKERGGWYECPDGKKRRMADLQEIFTNEFLEELNKHTVKFKRLSFEGSDVLGVLGSNDEEEMEEAVGYNPDVAANKEELEKEASKEEVV